MSDLRPNIWLLQAQGDSKGLRDALQNADPDVRRRAAVALRMLGAAEAIPALRRALDVEPDAETRLHLQLTFEDLIAEQRSAEVQQTQTARQLVAQLGSGDPSIVIKAAHALGKLQNKTAVEALVLIFHNTRLPATVRLTAAEALIELESAPALVTLLAALKSDSWRNRRNAAAVLGQLRADWAVPRLADRLGDEHEAVQRTARAALQRIGTADALKALDDFDRPRTRRKTGPLPGTGRLSPATVPEKPAGATLPAPETSAAESPAAPLNEDDSATTPPE